MLGVRQRPLFDLFPRRPSRDQPAARANTPSDQLCSPWNSRLLPRSASGASPRVSARLRVFACSSVSVSVCVSGWLCVLVSAFACIPVGVCVCLSTCAPQHTCLPVCTCLSVTRGVCVTLCVHMSQCALVRTHVSGRGGCPHMSVCVCPGAHVRAHVPWLCVHICTSGHVCVNLGVHVSTCPCVSVCPHVPTWSLRVRAWESRYVSLHVVSWLKACVAWKSTFTVILDLANENKLFS